MMICMDSTLTSRSPSFSMRDTPDSIKALMVLMRVEANISQNDYVSSKFSYVLYAMYVIIFHDSHVISSLKSLNVKKRSGLHSLSHSWYDIYVYAYFPIRSTFHVLMHINVQIVLLMSSLTLLLVSFIGFEEWWILMFQWLRYLYCYVTFIFKLCICDVWITFWSLPLWFIRCLLRHMLYFSFVKLVML